MVYLSTLARGAVFFFSISFFFFFFFITTNIREVIRVWLFYIAALTPSLAQPEAQG
jgi:hypothetical protein